MTGKSSVRGLLLPFILLLLVSVPVFYWNASVRFAGLDGRWAIHIRYTLGVLLWLIAAFTVNRLINLLIWDALLAKRFKYPIPKLLRDMAGVVIYTIAVGIIAGVVFGKDLTVLAATLGGTGVVVGFALQKVIADLFAGLTLNLERPFRPGDWILSPDGEWAKVMEITWRATHLRSVSNMRLTVPNSVFTSSTIKNFTTAGHAPRQTLDFHVDFNVAPARVVRLLEAAVFQEAGQRCESPMEDTGLGHKVSLTNEVRVIETTERGFHYQILFHAPFDRGQEVRKVLANRAMENLTKAGIRVFNPSHWLQQVDLPDPEDQVLYAAFRRVPVFACFADDEIRELARGARRIQLKRDEDLIKQGEQGDTAFLLFEGLLDVLIWIEAKKENVKVASLPAGAFLGEISLLTGEPRTATCRAACDSVAYELSRPVLSSIFEKRPEVLMHLSEVMAEHKQSDKKNITAQSAEEQSKAKESLAGEILHKLKGLFHFGKGAS